MKKIFFLFSATLVLSQTLCAQTWVNKTGLPSGNARNHPVSWALGGFGYSATGATETDESTKDFFKYNPATDSWERLSDFPGAERTYSIGDVYQGKGYLGFGSNDTGLLNDLWRYDPATNNWEQLASCPCVGRQHPTFTINKGNGKIYVGEGNNLTNNLKDWWEYDIATNTWTAKADFPGTRRHHPFQFSIGNYSYSGLGHDDGASMATADFYRYNPADNTWARMADAPGARIAGTQFDYNGYGFALSGEGDHHMPSTPSIFWRYDPAANTWQTLEPHPGGSLWAPGSFIINGTLYLFGGVYRPDGPEVYFQNMWAYDLQNALSVTNKAKEEHSMQLFPNPSTNIVHVTFGTQMQQAHQQHIKVYDVKGSIVYADVTINKGELSFSTKNLAAGNYFVAITDHTGVIATGKFVKE